ncbi:MAG TPA: DEAD/DEAH box helicase [Flavobacterium sp.]|jgi:superfamily II DNA or RNA helicase
MENVSAPTLAEKPKSLYSHQQNDISVLTQKLQNAPKKARLLYQLPTGGGKTVVFSEIAKQFIDTYKQKVLVLTHRTELCRQTSATLRTLGVSNKIINSSVQRLPLNNGFNCYVAMVETLKNRLKTKKIRTEDVGLVIIDEAHHNSFRKLLGNFKNAAIIGVTATPFSSDKNLPLRNSYDELVTGEDIVSLIEKGFLAKPKTVRYNVELNSLATGIHGDFTVSTSDALYSSQAMLNLLLNAYEEHSKGKKTLIFNNGIFTSRRVYDVFSEAGYAIRHLDNKTPAAERKEILKWFRKTKNAILTSVSILTTGFDEPSVQTVILNRATTSLTLYHQMIGRGSRKLPRKQTFTIIDLGNNTERFGEWNQPIDWAHVFEHPEIYYEMLSAQSHSESAHAIPTGLRTKFPNSLEVAFDVEQEYKLALEEHRKTKSVIQKSIRQHVLMCLENSTTVAEAIELANELSDEIQWRVKQYVKCLENTTKNYRDWLEEEYKSRLNMLIRKMYIRSSRAS